MNELLPKYNLSLHVFFKVDCKELFYRDLPEMNDSIAEKILSGCSTIDEASLGPNFCMIY